MTGRQVIQSIDYHTAGEPFRIITGAGPIPGATMLEKRRHAKNHLDHVRRLVINEPRGHADMYGCFVTDPVSLGGHLGVLFFHNAGYSTACGHGTIALVTAALETGLLPMPENTSWPAEIPVVLDAPSGTLETVALMESPDRVHAVRFRNVPAFVAGDQHLRLPDGKQIKVTIAYGGAFYALVDARSVGLHIQPADLPALIACGRTIKAAIEAIELPVHPIEPELHGIYGVIFAETIEPRSSTRPRHDRNVTIFADGEVDRSPCGSGTSARLAALHARGEIATSEPLIHESIIGTRFVGRVVKETNVAGHPAVITEIEGSAWLTGYHTFVLEIGDPLGTGFLLR